MYASRLFKKILSDGSPRADLFQIHDNLLQVRTREHCRGEFLENAAILSGNVRIVQQPIDQRVVSLRLDAAG